MRLVPALILVMASSAIGAEENSGWIEYPAETLKARQQRGHAPLISTTSVRNEDGLVVISDFGSGGEYIRCFDTFTEEFQPVGQRVCWRR